MRLGRHILSLRNVLIFASEQVMGTSDEAKDFWLGCSISQPRVVKEHITHLVVAPGVGPTSTAQSVVGFGAQESTATRPAGNGFIRMIGSQAEADRSDEFGCIGTANFLPLGLAFWHRQATMLRRHGMAT